jgi:hypothetical protein
VSITNELEQNKIEHSLNNPFQQKYDVRKPVFDGLFRVEIPIKVCCP